MAVPSNISIIRDSIVDTTKSIIDRISGSSNKQDLSREYEYTFKESADAFYAWLAISDKNSYEAQRIVAVMFGKYQGLVLGLGNIKADRESQILLESKERYLVKKEVYLTKSLEEDATNLLS